jgi:hypothetical protein
MPLTFFFNCPYSLEPFVTRQIRESLTVEYLFYLSSLEQSKMRNVISKHSDESRMRHWNP